MAADDTSYGFHSYADGTPRGYAGEPEPRPAVRWSETPAYLEDSTPVEPGADWRRIAVVAGAAAGLTAAAAFGWTALQRRDAPPATAAAEPPGVEVVVADPPPAPAPPKAARLEVLPPTAQVEAPRTFAIEPPPAPTVAASRPAMRPAPAPRNSFNDCRDAPTAARRMVCGDMRVAAADQRMKEAFAAAMDAGVPYRRLARDQRAWLEDREDAAQVSRGAVLDAYRDRTRELWAMARERD